MIDITVGTVVLALLTLAVLALSAAVTSLKNRIRRIERTLGLDQFPPNDLDRPPEEDTEAMKAAGG